MVSLTLKSFRYMTEKHNKGSTLGNIFRVKTEVGALEIVQPKIDIN